MGIIDISALSNPPEKHELETAKFFANSGKDVYFIRPSNIKGTHTPDFWIDGKMWETKSPKGKTVRCVSDNIRDAAKQSRYIILDFRRFNVSTEKCLGTINHALKVYRCRKIIVIPRGSSTIKDVLTFGPDGYRM